MLYTKAQWHWYVSSGADVCEFLPYMGMVVIFVLWSRQDGRFTSSRLTDALHEINLSSIALCLLRTICLNILIAVKYSRTHILNARYQGPRSFVV